MSSWRNSGNQRRYSRDVLRKISIIKAAQKVGISLEEIKKAFSKLPNKCTPNEEDWQELSNNWKNELNKRIDYLTKLRDNLSRCIGCGCLLAHYITKMINSEKQLRAPTFSLT
ncbi:redox-sensitive transcriptional activator SoxR [Francisella halioticida]|uniref:redox-sensitive transcriptional activator SoxR n=1 Tax=Francisella halioticida TaxID=549298 RepID=UPI00308404ED